MRIEQLEHLAAVTRHGSFRRASEHVHLSQPALSESVRNLERELGVQLLERRRTGTRTTAEGERLLRPMQEVIEAARRLRVAADAPAPPRPLRVVVTYVDTGGFVVGTLRSLSEGRSLEVSAQGSAAEAINTLDGAADACVLLHDATAEVPASLQATQLWRGGVDVLMLADCALASRAKVGVADLVDFTVISALPSHVGQPAAAWRCTQAPLTHDAVRAGVGIGLVPALPRHDDDDLVVRPLVDGPTLALTLLRTH